MRRRSRFVHTPALVLGVIVLVVAVAGGAYAATIGGGTITVCVHKKGGSLYKAKKCSKGDSKLSWNAKGVAGATGATGATGPAGPTGATGATGSAGAAGAAGTNGLSHGYFTSETGSSNITSTFGAGAFTQIGHALALNAGSYAISGQVALSAGDANNPDARFLINCELSNGSATDQDSFSSETDGVFDLAEDTLPFTLDVTNAAASTASIGCVVVGESGEDASFIVSAGPVNISAVAVNALN